MQQAGRAAQQQMALGGAGRADIADVGRELRLDLTLKMTAVLHNAGQDQWPARGARHTAGVRSTFVGMNAAEEQQVIAALQLKGELLKIEATMNGREMGEIRKAVGIRDADVVCPAVEDAVHRHDTLAGDAADGCHHKVSTRLAWVSGRKS